MDSSRRTYLFYRHFDGTATPDERLELAALLQGIENEKIIQQLMAEAWDTFSGQRDIFPEEQSERMLQNVLAQRPEPSVDWEEHAHSSPEPVFLWRRISIAVSALLALGIGLYYYKQQSITVTEKAVASVIINNDIQPGGNKALLTLSDGKTIELDHVSKGVLTRQGDVSVIKTGDGQLAYRVSKEAKSARIGYNILKTPRGGQYHLVLPDGSKVWLNAASSIRYPTAFDDVARRVEINGEAYFEINKVTDKSTAAPRRVPFIVKVNDVEVEVLGTHFNINAYGDAGGIKTTLLEGSVRIRKGNRKSLLRPGQQANVARQSAAIQVKEVDVRQSVAWKEGYFRFEKAGLAEIMGELTKWYDVEVHYEGKLPDRKFSGEIPRSATLSQVLEILEISKVHLDIAEKQVLLKP
ncbi:iron dicitrate transporter FecR [Dyadobacter beijingensis]|uniref:Iron dicitrate transporter FecR n=1 Tax=Dyadobacter beijingensis TaxID=365489 RepID=A0ABQ2HVF9_9BACT|nr:FecR family protein [Dyadobacter beijingensis]GGM89349.1 iron dicitrate transporter FecR [Dyadobacter beijingensis]